MNQEFVKPLIKKANQIANNTADVNATANHISRFWTQHMCEELLKHINNNGGGLNDIALQAMQQVKEQRKLAS